MNDITNDNRPPRYIEDGKVIYRASGIGGCIRALVAGASHYEPVPHPSWFAEILREGNKFEDTILGMFGGQRGGEVEDRQKEVNLFIGKIEGREVWLRGKIDGTFVGVPVDAKKVRLSTWLDFQQRGVEYIGAWPWQISAYMHAMAAEQFLLIGGCLDTEKQEIVELHVETIMNPPIPLRAIKQKIAKVEALIAEEDVTVACDVKMYPCPFYFLHDVDAEEPPERITDEVMVDAAERFRYVQMSMDTYMKQVKELDRQKRKIAEEMREWLEKNGMRDADRLVLGEGINQVEVKRVRYPKREYLVKATTVDYFSVKRPQTSPPMTIPNTEEDISVGTVRAGSTDMSEDSIQELDLKGVKGSTSGSRKVGVPKPKRRDDGED